jgi:hypothetical protein
LSARFAKLECRALFEQSDEFARVAMLMDALYENVNMVRHQAECVQLERLAGGALEQYGHHPLCDTLFPQVGCAMVAADGHKIALPPEIILRRKPRNLSMNGHPAAFCESAGHNLPYHYIKYMMILGFVVAGL